MTADRKREKKKSFILKFDSKEMIGPQRFWQNVTGLSEKCDRCQSADGAGGGLKMNRISMRIVFLATLWISFMIIITKTMKIRPML